MLEGNPALGVEADSRTRGAHPLGGWIYAAHTRRGELAGEEQDRLGVSEADVMSVLESGELKGKKIGASWRISRAALTSYMSA